LLAQLELRDLANRWQTILGSWNWHNRLSGSYYLGCKQRIRSAVNDRIGIEPNP
jgi:hypothetical protein